MKLDLPSLTRNVFSNRKNAIRACLTPPCVNPCLWSQCMRTLVRLMVAWMGSGCLQMCHTNKLKPEAGVDYITVPTAGTTKTLYIGSDCQVWSAYHTHQQWQTNCTCTPICYKREVQSAVQPFQTWRHNIYIYSFIVLNRLKAFMKSPSIHFLSL